MWVLADLYEQDGSGEARHGQDWNSALGRTVAGRVAFLDPMLDPKTRTLKARLEFPNPGGELRLTTVRRVRLKVGSRRVYGAGRDLDSG